MSDINLDGLWPAVLTIMAVAVLCLVAATALGALLWRRHRWLGALLGCAAACAVAGVIWYRL